MRRNGARPLLPALVSQGQARYVEQIRVRAAQALLETGNAGITAIARTCGFGSAQTMRRAFLRVAGVTPAAYRRRFRTQQL